MEKLDKSFYSREEVEGLIRNSVSEERKRARAKWRKGAKTLAAIIMALTTFATSIAAATVFGINSFIEKKNEKKLVESYLSDTMASVDDQKEGRYDTINNRPGTYYDDIDLANRLVAEKDNFDLELFGQYLQICKTSSFSDAEIRTTMNNILTRAAYMINKSGNNVVDYSSFEDYVIKMGFVDKDGKADYQKYRNTMLDLVAKKAIAEQAIEDAGIGGR